ncbi:hypothetical protein [Peptoanaerobacter stomatis]|uniref:Uncharacterized protein n=1 Tax=Peptoanaerobacter stomatis TaxID=796937 RepID=G9X207_9FIRM|nr:hypothetical protein [Peptoanaerobacter stomatis]EHL13130.1 hypothetical protein HMPREF9629_00430 [Peptoanaerobacter stomatis]
MSKVFKLNKIGVRELLKGEDMKKVLSEKADEIVGRCGDGFESDTHIGRNRANVLIKTNSIKSYYKNLKENTILKALK